MLYNHWNSTDQLVVVSVIKTKRPGVSLYSVSSILSPTFCSVNNLFATLSSPAPANLSLYHRVYPALTYSGRVRGNSRDVLLRSMLMV